MTSTPSDRTSGDRDRLRELLDAVLADKHSSLDEMAGGAFSSPFHFSRQVSRGVGESPVALRRRVLLERAAWLLQHGRTVTEVAFDSGYESVDGFARAFTRAFGHSPGRAASTTTPAEHSHWLPAPNGIHFHSPTVLYVDSGTPTTESAGDVLMLMVRHDLDDVGVLLDAAKGIDDDEWNRRLLPGHEPLHWNGPEESLAQVMSHLVVDKQPWLATIEGADMPPDPPVDLPTLVELHRELTPRWLALIRDIDRRNAWQDRVIDALCDPPESFLLSQIVAHVLTFSAHRRQLARWMLRAAGVDVAAHDPDPIMWHRKHSGGF
ncbi:MULTISPECIES: helix-turn-helix domain-containing protein [Gordonia]|uniref:helix-turn-helix domain-containing protein n=1 Tax=Gordonia TaxID=2053 RepID=UPI0009659395|nr:MULTISPECIES: helix-turn-helix domain-containing protein [Gordonia]MDH3006905.1 helix-turn-helix domain-containing protein [Gordonia alkanivorans]MDH3011819.1 helix-turn-helix domain-containing protein [Gordonia alkanivorans]MDH3016472.1 helix-turn-helix domain-containing protein [Gordonia alkanivorans]MDH3041639.1 helix-turn-helix domain-containing protein [Gordonia alkanivorans]MDH3060294.1 helix-turn-helix domain-containing protein [Gordonia alkanivorans]